MNALISLLRGDRDAEKVVPPSGFTAILTVAASAAMAFLAVFALALAMSAGRQADQWQAALADSATIRISAGDAAQSQAEIVETILGQLIVLMRDLAATEFVPGVHRISADQVDTKGNEMSLVEVQMQTESEIANGERPLHLKGDTLGMFQHQKKFN